MVNIIINWLVAHPEADLNVVLGGGALSLVLEKLLTKYKINSKKFAFTLLHVFAFITAALTTYLANLKGLAPAGLYASLAIAASFWHRFMISGIYTKDVEPVLNDLANFTVAPTAKAVTAPLSSASLNQATPQIAEK